MVKKNRDAEIGRGGMLDDDRVVLLGDSRSSVFAGMGSSTRSLARYTCLKACVYVC